MSRTRWWLVFLALALVYPLATLAGGMPAFPTRDDCVRPATSEGELDAVFGYVDSEREGRALRDRALGAGFTGTEYEQDGCGRVRVFVSGIPSLEVGREFAKEARSVGFDVTLEQSAE